MEKSKIGLFRSLMVNLVRKIQLEYFYMHRYSKVTPLYLGEADASTFSIIFTIALVMRLQEINKLVKFQRFPRMRNCATYMEVEMLAYYHNKWKIYILSHILLKYANICDHRSFIFYEIWDYITLYVLDIKLTVF